MSPDGLFWAFIGLTLVTGVFAYFKWGWKGALVVLGGGFLGLGAFLLSRRRTASPVVPPPPPPRGADVRVTEVAKDEVSMAATAKRDAITVAADDPDRLAAVMRNQQ